MILCSSGIYGTKHSAKEAMSWAQFTLMYPSAGRYFAAEHTHCQDGVCRERKQQSLGEVADVSTLRRLGRKKKGHCNSGEKWRLNSCQASYPPQVTLCPLSLLKAGGAAHAGLATEAVQGGETLDTDRQWNIVPTHRDLVQFCLHNDCL